MCVHYMIAVRVCNRHVAIEEPARARPHAGSHQHVQSDLYERQGGCGSIRRAKIHLNRFRGGVEKLSAKDCNAGSRFLKKTSTPSDSAR